MGQEILVPSLVGSSASGFFLCCNQWVSWDWCDLMACWDEAVGRRAGRGWEGVGGCFQSHWRDCWKDSVSCWLLAGGALSSWHVGLSIRAAQGSCLHVPERESQQDGSHGHLQLNLGSASYHSCCVLFIRIKSLGPAHVQGQGITQGIKTTGGHFKVHLSHQLLHRCVSFGLTFLFDLLRRKRRFVRGSWKSSNGIKSYLYQGT